RLLSYMVRIWRDHVNKHPGAAYLPVIIPVVLHHGATGWRAESTFDTLFDVDQKLWTELAPFVPRFKFVLDDLAAVTDEVLYARAMTALGRLCLWCFKHARNPERLVHEIGRWAAVVRETRSAPNGRAALRRVFRYILELNERLGAKGVTALL